jgi:hypothetical protein
MVSRHGLLIDKLILLMPLLLGLQVEGVPATGSTWASGNASERSELGQSVPFIRVETKDRVQATLPERPVALAQPVQIPLKLKGPRVTAIYVMQSDKNKILTNRQRGTTPIGNGPAKVVAEDEVGKTIEITPLQVGNLHVEIRVEFVDGEQETENYTIKVQPTSTGLKEFTLHQGLTVLTLNHVKGSEMNERFLEPEATYEGLDYPIYLPREMSGIHVTIDQPQENPVIRVDKEGTIHALRKGKATIIGELGGMTDRVVAIVE